MEEPNPNPVIPDYLVNCIRKQFNANHPRGNSVYTCLISQHIANNPSWISFQITSDQRNYINERLEEKILTLDVDKLQGDIYDKTFLPPEQSSRIYDATMVDISVYIIETDKPIEVPTIGE